MMNNIVVTLLSATLLSMGASAHAAEEIRSVQPDLGPVILDPAGVDAELTVDRAMADDFAREALEESSDRPIVKQELIVRLSEGKPQMFWMVKLAGSWKTAYVYANGEREGTTIVDDERARKTPLVSGR